MPKFIYVNRAQAQATAGTVPDGSATTTTASSSADTAEFTDGTVTIDSDNVIPAILTETADVEAATKIESVNIVDISGDVFTLTRNADGEGGQDYTGGDCFISFAWDKRSADKCLQRDGDEVHSVGSVGYDNEASGTFDANNGQYQKCVLTGAGTAISASNIKPRSMLTMEIHAGVTYAPNISGLTGLWAEGIEPTFDAVNILHAVGLDDGTVKWIAGRRWS